MRIASPADAGPPRWSDAVTRRLWWVMVAVPVVILVVVAWQRRWIADDGFINLRIVRQWQEGRGPVFNPGERVEAGTSLLWPLLLAVVDLVSPIGLEHTTIVMSLALTASAMVLATAATRRLLADLPGSSGVPMPLGLAVFAVIPPVWDFTTSGLELPLTLMWLAWSWWLLVGLARDRVGIVAAALVWGGAIVVRPDLLLVGAALCAAGVALAVRDIGRWWRASVAFLAVPVAVTVFRAGFFGVLVPNTALTKEAGGARWDRGLGYVAEIVRVYWLAVPAAALVVFGVGVPAAAWLRSGERPSTRWLVLMAPVAGGTLHLVWLARVGGDFMHGRLVLPGLFALLLPVLVVPVRRWSTPVAVIVVTWCVVCGLALRRPGPALPSNGIADERRFYVEKSGSDNPVQPHDVLAGGADPETHLQRLVDAGRRARQAHADGVTGVFILGAEVTVAPPGAGPLVSPQVLIVGQVGLAGYEAGPEVYVADQFGLGDPVVARLVPERPGRAGHEKIVDVAVLARRVAPGWVPPDSAEVQAAADHLGTVLACPSMRELQRALSDDLDPGRVWRNITGAPARTSLRFPQVPPASGSVCPR